MTRKTKRKRAAEAERKTKMPGNSWSNFLMAIYSAPLPPEPVLTWEEKARCRAFGHTWSCRYDKQCRGEGELAEWRHRQDQEMYFGDHGHHWAYFDGGMSPGVWECTRCGFEEWRRDESADTVVEFKLWTGRVTRIVQKAKYALCVGPEAPATCTCYRCQEDAPIKAGKVHPMWDERAR